MRFSHGKGYAIAGEEEARGKQDREKHELGADNVLVIKELGQLRRYRGAYATRQIVESWYVSDIGMDAARNAKDRIAACEHL